ncbi:MAG: methylmalonyl-CoA epimerase [Anaerolineae bacterium]|nr:MAG: methylmalonyl-CoA epimerase [Anaerolineae bacterium]
MKINHLAVVVENLDSAMGFWCDALGLELQHTEVNNEEQVKIGFLTIGESRIELLEPTTPDSGIGKYLAKRGAGMHHLCVEVEDIDRAMQHLRERHIELINEVPKTNHEGTRYCFIHPRSTGGVLVELYQLAGK